VLPFVRQARHLGRYRHIVQVLGHHGFGYVVGQLGLSTLLSLPRRLVQRLPPPPPVSAAERLRQVLVELGPTFIKLGQLLSTRPDILPPDLLHELNKLQDTVPPFPSEIAIATIESELGQPLSRLFLVFDPTPLAAASLGQVHAAVLHSGEEVVVKVQRPDISGLINTDLAILADLAALAQERTALGEQYDLVELAWEFSNTLRDELDYTREALYAERFQRNFADTATVYIPTVYWRYTSHRVLTIERLYGIKINDIAALDVAGIDRKKLARHSLELVLAEIFEHGFFHADPHPGNFFAMPGAVIGAVDFGQVGKLDPYTSRQLLLLLHALVNYDDDGLLRAMERMHMVSRHQITPALRRDARRFIDRFVDRPLRELSMREVGDTLFSISQRHTMRMPSPVATLLKTLMMIEGIGQQIDPELDVFGIARPYAQRAAAAQMSPHVLADQVAGKTRDMAETLGALPQQLGNVLHRLNEGELVVRTREEELHRLAGALIGAANRLTLALVLSALIIGLGLVAVAVGVGQWQGVLPLTIGIVGGIAMVVTGLVLLLALLRGRDV
jgi:ubiquinone biosynthesis protein